MGGARLGGRCGEGGPGPGVRRWPRCHEAWSTSWRAVCGGRPCAGHRRSGVEPVRPGGRFRLPVKGLGGRVRARRRPETIRTNRSRGGRHRGNGIYMQLSSIRLPFWQSVYLLMDKQRDKETGGRDSVRSDPKDIYQDTQDNSDQSVTDHPSVLYKNKHPNIEVTPGWVPGSMSHE